MSDVVPSPIRVLHCIHSLSGGGAERQLQLLATASCRHGMTAGVFCVRDQGNEMDPGAVRVYKSQTDCKYNIALFRSLSEAIAQFQPDILHAWLPASVTIPTMLLAALRHIPCVWSYRNAMFFNRPLAVVEHFFAWCLVSRIISNNPIIRSSVPYRALYRMKDGVEIRNAVQVERQYQEHPILHATGTKRNILFAGRLTHQKNWHCLLRALPSVLRTHDIQLLICGVGEDSDQLQRMITDLHLSEHVSVLGYRRDIYRLMQESDVFVLPSWYEGMANVFLEALAVGVPCVVSDIPANRDMIEDTRCALTFNPASSDELADRLTCILGSPDLAASLIQAGRKVAAAHSPEQLAIEHVAVYSELAASVRRKKSFNID